MPSPLGDKIRALRKQKKLSLEQLAELTESSKSYIWELENKDDPRPSADKISKIAAVLEATTDSRVSSSWYSFSLVMSRSTPRTPPLVMGAVVRTVQTAEPSGRSTR